MNPALEQQIDYRRAARGPFLSSWYPLLGTLRGSLIDWMVEASGLGADLVALELPSARGLFFDSAGELLCRTADDSIGLEETFDLVAARRAEIDAPVLLITYVAPLIALGADRAAEQALTSGVDAICVVDLPPDDESGLSERLGDAGLGRVYGVTAASDRRRLGLLARASEGLLWSQDLFEPFGSGLSAALRDHRRVARKTATLLLADPTEVPEPRLVRRLSGILLRRVGAAALEIGADLGGVENEALRELRGEGGG